VGADELNHAEPQWVTRMGLQEHIRETYGIDMSRKRICTLAGVWDLDWGAIKQASAPLSVCFCGRSTSYSWLAKNAPKTLTNDVESALNQ